MPQASILAGSIKRKSGEQDQHNDAKQAKLEDTSASATEASVQDEPKVAIKEEASKIETPKQADPTPAVIVQASALRALPLGDYGSGSDEE